MKNKVNLALISIMITIIIAVIGFAVSWGTISNRVDAAEKDIIDIKEEFQIINEKLDCIRQSDFPDIRERVKEVETKLDLLMNGDGG